MRTKHATNVVHARWCALVMVVVGCVGGCSFDLDAIPSYEGDAGPVVGDGDGRNLCVGARNGTPCGENVICVSQRCVMSECGDGYVDGKAGEECETGADCVQCMRVCVGPDCDDAGEDECPDGGMEETEICDGLDNDCDGEVDEDTPSLYVDSDRDGYGRVDMPVACTLEEGFSADIGDCNDTDELIGPEQEEACDNGLDDDCDFGIDEGCACAADITQICGPQDGEGMLLGAGECDLGEQLCEDGIYGACEGATPPAVEICDGKDNDCDNAIDEEVGLRCYQDGDRDGFAPMGDVGRPVCDVSCTAEETEQAPVDELTTDCDDVSGIAYPGADEACNTADDDCDGYVDEDSLRAFYPDGDEDGFGSTTGAQMACTAPMGFVDNDDDCDDGDPARNPNADETCDSTDFNCNGDLVDDLDCTCTPGMEEDCGSSNGMGGFLSDGICVIGTITCDENGDWGSCENATYKLDDELCNGADDDCDGNTDEGFVRLGTACTVGRGGCAASGEYVCTADGSTTECSVTAGSPVDELCDGIDNDCDGDIDEPFSLGMSCGSSVGECKTGVVACDGSGGTYCEGEVTDRTEICNMLDDDCDMMTDEAVSPTQCYPDADGDGYAVSGATPTPVCGNCGINSTSRAPMGASNIDCAPNDVNINPGADEVCDGVDNNCVGGIDEDFNIGAACGTGACAGGTRVCNGPDGTVCSSAGNSSTEVCDSVDNDCDGENNEGLSCNCLPSDPPRACGSDVGECVAGTQSCQANGQWGACSDTGPTNELCNGKDDNCANGVDELWPTKGDDCTVGTGACEATGQWVCNNAGTGLRCNASPGSATTEECNDIDDDCDGVVDNGPGAKTRCYVDGDGDGYARENADSDLYCTCPINTTAVVPTGVNRDCDDTTAAFRPGLNDTCNNQDNDCDGKVDENTPNYLNKGTSCGTNTGICSAGTLQCNGAGTALTCQEETTGLPEDTICNGLDDDCDGPVDEEFPTKGNSCGTNTGVCSAGTYQCNAAGTGVYCANEVTGSADDASCNDQDDDCDGLKDEDFRPYCSNNTTLQVCSSGSVSPQNCATANDSCITTNNGDGTFTGACGGDCAHGQTRCLSSTQPQTCDEGTWDNESTCAYPNFVCALSGGVHDCVANPQETLGKNTATGNILDLFDDVLYMQPIRVPWNANLEEFGIRTPSNHSGGRAYLALYTDSGGPVTLINRTNELFPILAGNPNAQNPYYSTAASIELNANTKYWIVAYIAVGGSDTVRIYNDTAGGAEGDYLTADQAYRSPLNSLSGKPTFENTGDISLYIKVRRR